MKVLVTGSTGLVGTELIHYLKRKGHQPVRLVRKKGNFNEPQIGWDVQAGKLNPADLEGIEGVIHLAGENIMGRWNAEHKRKIEESRVKGTRLIAETIAGMDTPPKVIVSASAVGFYGNRGDEMLTEVSAKGTGFLADTCKKWEDACQPARDKGIRVANARLGVILSPKGGALKLMAWPFRLGLAGNLGSGKQYFPWITLEDVVASLEFILTHDAIQGPVNIVAPQSVTNAEFTDAMRKTLIPPILPMRYWTPPAPALAVKAIAGEMGEEMLLAGQRIQPIVLQENGYEFKYPQLKPALEHML